ncbi:MAG: DNA polymerase I, partial [Bacteroidales bacterium]|nr:DNA polymerase I [Bacteroidales bacterium]
CVKFGIKRPEQVIDILGLWGDASDNIPGIPGIGEKRAKELIAEFDSIENLIKNTDKLKGKIRENVENYAEQGILSKSLATILINVPVEFLPEELKVGIPDTDSLNTLFEELEFRTFAKRFFTKMLPPEDQSVQNDLFNLSDEAKEEPTILTIESVQKEYTLAESEEQRKSIIYELGKSKEFCFDTETTGLDPNNSELIGISFCITTGKAWYVPLPENYQDCLIILEEFRGVFENEEIIKIGQNIKYDISILKWYEMEVEGKLFDTMIAHYLIQPDMRHNMDILAETYLNYKTVSIESLIGKKGKKQASMRSVPINTLKDYACEDADITFQLKQVFDPILSESGIKNLFNQIEMPLVPVLASMEAEGIKIDIGALKNYSEKLEKEIRQIESEIYALAEANFNIASPKQLGEVLFEKLKITDKPKMTKTKQYSTSEDVLQKLSKKHPIVQLILDYRSLTKLKSTYVDVLPTMVNPRTGRIHTTYNQAVAATGRLSSNNPNLQNIPIRTERGREIRKAFVPKNNRYILLSADYSQIELRIIAEISGDKGMVEAFQNGEDIHTSTAAKVYGIPVEEVTTEKRRYAKTVNFGIIYGISAFGLSERLNIPRKEARNIIDAYFIQYPGIRSYMDQTIEFARKNGYVETIMKRRRYIRDINSANSVVRGFAERNAINAPIQGSSADMIKIAMINIQKEIFERNLKSSMLLQVHDELVFDVDMEELGLIKDMTRNHMLNAVPMKVPLVVEINTGQTWLEAH